MDSNYKEAMDKLIQRLYMSQRMDYIKIEKLQEEIIKLKKEIAELSIELDLHKSKKNTNI